MAVGDVIIFDEAKAAMLDGGWEALDPIHCAILDNTLTPIKAHVSPTLTLFTEVGVAGSYSAGGIDLGDYGDLIAQSGGVVTFDSAVNPTWAQNGSNDADAYWGLIYHVASDIGIGFVELGGPVDMSAGALTITWHANGVFTIGT